MPTIALVDDDRNILTSVSIALEAEGYRITTYTDGASALDGFKTTLPDLAILDIKMPRMDGMETLRRLRQKVSLSPSINGKEVRPFSDKQIALLQKRGMSRDGLWLRMPCPPPWHFSASPMQATVLSS